MCVLNITSKIQNQTFLTRTWLSVEYNESRRSFSDFKEVLYSFNLPKKIIKININKKTNQAIKSAEFQTNKRRLNKKESFIMVAMFQNLE